MSGFLFNSCLCPLDWWRPRPCDFVEQVARRAMGRRRAQLEATRGTYASAARAAALVRATAAWAWRAFVDRLQARQRSTTD